MKKAFIIIALVLFSAIVVKAEVLSIAPADIAQIAYSNCRAQRDQYSAIINALLKEFECEFKEGQIVCPDEKVEDEETTP